MVIDVSFLQLAKAFPSIRVSFDVIFTVFKLKHPENVNSLISVTRDGIVMDVNDSHPSNALAPIFLTEDGIDIEVRIVQLQKAYVPIDVSFDVIFTFSKLLHPRNM